MFFVAGSTPSVQFTVTPVNLAASAVYVVPQLGGVNVSYACCPTAPTSVTWPCSAGMQTARLIVTPAAAGVPVKLQATGPWAVFSPVKSGTVDRGRKFATL